MAADEPTPAALLSRLRAECARRAAQVEALQAAFTALVAASEDSNADDEHDPEGATIAFERAQLSAQLAHARSGLADAHAAIARAADGTYGRCAVCGRAIGAARLDARPTTTTCVTCAAR